MSEWDEAVDTVSDIAGVGAQFGGLVAAEYGLPEEAGEVIFGAAAGVGAAVGVGIEYATDHAISEGISDGLMGLVGEEESYAAASAFDDGDYLGGVGHMASGAWDTASEAGAETYEAVSDYASETYEAVSDYASETYDSVSETAGEMWDAVTDW